MKRLVILGIAVLMATACLGKPVPVANGDFEQGLGGWKLYEPEGFAHGQMALETNDVHGGKQAVRITNATGAKVMVGLTPAATIALPDDCRTFALTAWMKSDVSPEMVELRVASCGKDGNQLSPWQEHGWRFFRPPLEPHRGQWHQIRCEFGAMADWGGFQLTFWVNGPGANVVIDDIALETIDPDYLRVPQAGQRLPDPAPGTSLWWERPEVKVYPGEKPPVATGKGLSLAACGGEYECVQLCLRPGREVKDATVQFTDLKGPGALPASALRANFVGYVDVKAALQGRSIMGPTPDPLLTETTRTLPADQASVIWLTLKVPRGTKAGEYKGTVSLSGEGLQVKIPLQVRVFGFDLPETPTLRTIARVWQKHDGYDDLFRANLREHRCSGGLFSPGIKAKRVEGGDAIEVDASGLPEAVAKQLRPNHFNLFNVPSVYLGDWSGPYAKDRKWSGFDLFTPPFYAAYEEYCRKVAAALRSAGVMAEAIWQIWDEPHDEQVAWCRELAAAIKRAAPEARVYVTTGVKRDLLDSVDIWCLPWPETYNAELAREVLKRGGELFAYENSLYSLDVADSSLQLRSYLWRLRKYDVTGVEWWAISQWKSDPWRVANQYEPQNGGGFFLYPTPDRKGAPVDSIRWELYREGVEDYDLLNVLAREQDQALAALGCRDARFAGAGQVQTLVSRVALDMTEVVRDARAADEARREAARRIEFLRAQPGGVVATALVKGKPVLLIVAPGNAAVTVNGKAYTARLAAAAGKSGDSVKVTITRGKVSKTVTVRLP